MQETNNFMVKVTVQTLIDALSKIKDKEQFVILSTETESYHYLQHIYHLRDDNEDGSNVIALTSNNREPSDYFHPIEINM